MLKIIVHIIFIVLFLLITFFGMGPVVFADGTTNERILTLIAVILVYAIWIWGYRYFIKRMRFK